MDRLVLPSPVLPGLSYRCESLVQESMAGQQLHDTHTQEIVEKSAN